MGSRKLMYLINPKSGTSSKEGIRQLIEQATKARGIEFSIHPTNPNGQYDILKEQIAKESYTDVIIVGGDGTVNQVTNALRSLPIQFGIIPMGSGNGLARSAGIPLKPKEALQVIFEGRSKMNDAFLINQQYSCMLSGIGFDAQVAHDFATKTTRGFFTYTQQSIINFFKATPYPFEVVLPDCHFSTEAFFISIANSNQFGNEVTIAPDASLHDGLLDIVIVQKMNKAKLPFLMLKHIKSNHQLQNLVEAKGKKNILYFQTDRLQIKNIEMAPLHIDGEPKPTAANFNIQILQNCFQLIQ